MRFLVSRLLLVSVLAPSLTGCSFLFVEGPPPKTERKASFDCTTNPGVPALDATLSLLMLLRTIYVVSRPPSAFGGASLSQTDQVALGSGGLLLFGASAVTGFERTGDCRRAISDELQKQAQPGPGMHRAAPATPSPPARPVYPDDP